MNLENVSKYLLAGLMGLSIVVILVFFIVGFSDPYEVNPKLNDPRMLDLFMGLIIAFIAICAVSMLVSFIMFIKEHGFDKSIIFTWGLPIVGVGVGLIFGMTMKDDHMLINGKDWCNPSESLLTDASMIAIGILALVAIGVTAWSMISESTKK
jgi:O-antigen/teichoic acid export membrane protein